jgi:hypothetical protein
MVEKLPNISINSHVEPLKKNQDQRKSNLTKEKKQSKSKKVLL